MRADDLPLFYNAVAILEHNLDERADKPAVYCHSRTMTFHEVSSEVNQVANALKRLDVRIGEAVGLLTYDTPEWVTSFFGSLKAGAVSLGLNTFLTTAEFDYALRDSHARVLIVHEDFLPRINEIRHGHPFLKHVIVIGNAPGEVNFSSWIRDEATDAEQVRTHREDLATLNYSSGTTGQPKGIPHSHKDLPLTAQMWGVNVLGLRESDRTFSLSKLFFTFGTGGNLIFPWYVGASIVLYPGAPRLVEQVLDIVVMFKPTIFYNAPTGYAMALSIPDLVDRYDLSSIRLCVSAGEALPAPIWLEWKERTGIDIIDGIGCTEIYHIFISNRPDDIRPGSSGKPVKGFEVKITNEAGQAVELGEIGNLLVRGETTSPYYLHQYDKSRLTFRGEWLLTGDKYYVDEDGYYWHAGRSDDLMKVGGIWVSPTEVESTLIGHQAVAECAVVAKANRLGLHKPKAFVVLCDGYLPSNGLALELIQYCRDSMAEYKRPRSIEFVEDLPKTATGKIQRFKLRG